MKKTLWLLSALLISFNQRLCYGDTLLSKLGLPPSAKVLIIQADDMGLHPALNAAVMKSMKVGTVTSTGLLVNAPHFEEYAKRMVPIKDKDVGVHIALVNDLENYPFGPLSHAKSLADPKGFFWTSLFDFQKHATLKDIRSEILQQIEAVRNAGFQPTHIDSHMGVLYTPKYLDFFLDLAKETGLPPMLPRQVHMPADYVKGMGVSLDELRKAAEKKANEGYPVIDHLYLELGGKNVHERRAAYYYFFRHLEPGVSELLVDLSYPDRNLKKMVKGSTFENRYQDLAIFNDPRTLSYLHNQNIKLIGYEDLKRVAWKK
jgi:chitin disaccharide deacetylase